MDNLNEPTNEPTPEQWNKIMRPSGVSCQSCLKEINFGEDVIEVRVGKLEALCNNRVKTGWITKEFFHKGCDIAVRGL